MIKVFIISMLVATLYLGSMVYMKKNYSFPGRAPLYIPCVIIFLPTSYFVVNPVLSLLDVKTKKKGSFIQEIYPETRFGYVVSWFMVFLFSLSLILLLRAFLLPFKST